MYFGGRETEMGRQEVEVQEVERKTDKILVKK